MDHFADNKECFEFIAIPYISVDCAKHERGLNGWLCAWTAVCFTGVHVSCSRSDCIRHYVIPCQ